ncbi:uncharacterized protein LOC62_01G001584 [Vanrija pseudolonga]|uniref:Uncharacterized protein n=1 Tax=Vanrija pseudolonga TaxID=143232 RepID=A0AAF0Y282_9TREE|nr:hypothetical protein LOC62_01G001584 [Vanrija pseudolonga]
MIVDYADKPTQIVLIRTAKVFHHLAAKRIYHTLRISDDIEAVLRGWDVAPTATVRNFKAPILAHTQVLTIQKHECPDWTPDVNPKSLFPNVEVTRVEGSDTAIQPVNWHLYPNPHKCAFAAIKRSKIVLRNPLDAAMKCVGHYGWGRHLEEVVYFIPNYSKDEFAHHVCASAYEALEGSSTKRHVKVVFYHDWQRHTLSPYGRLGNWWLRRLAPPQDMGQDSPCNGMPLCWVAAAIDYITRHAINVTIVGLETITFCTPCYLHHAGYETYRRAQVRMLSEEIVDIFNYRNEDDEGTLRFTTLKEYLEDSESRSFELSDTE